MKVALVGGTAGLGFGLALRLATSGAEVRIGSRTSEKGASAAEEVARRTGARVSGDTNDLAVAGCDLAVVTVPFAGQAATYGVIKDSLAPGTPVCDCTAPLASEVGGRVTRLLGIWEGSAAQQARAILGSKIPLASGFHTIPAEVLSQPGAPIGDVLVCGVKQARDAVEKMVGLLGGARFIDCGPLDAARILESLTALLIGINSRYEAEGAGVEITRLGESGR